MPFPLQSLEYTVFVLRYSGITYFCGTELIYDIYMIFTVPMLGTLYYTALKLWPKEEILPKQILYYLVWHLQRHHWGNSLLYFLLVLLTQENIKHHIGFTSHLSSVVLLGNMSRLRSMSVILLVSLLLLLWVQRLQLTLPNS